MTYAPHHKTNVFLCEMVRRVNGPFLPIKSRIILTNKAPFFLLTLWNLFFSQYLSKLHLIPLVLLFFSFLPLTNLFLFFSFTIQQKEILTMSKTEHKQTDQKACLSTSSCPAPSIMSSDNNSVPRDAANNAPRPPSQRSKTAPSVIQRTSRLKSQRSDCILVACFILVYFELAWLIMVLLHSHSRH